MNEVEDRIGLLLHYEMHCLWSHTHMHRLKEILSLARQELSFGKRNILLVTTNHTPIVGDASWLVRMVTLYPCIVV
jgi:hypothetical protein